MANENKVIYYEVPRVGSIRELLSRARDEAGERIAFRYFREGEVREATFRAFCDRVAALGAALADLGVQASSIAMIGPNSYDYVTVYLTVLSSCGVFVPIDRDLPEEDLVAVLAHSGAEAVFCSEKYEELLLARRGDLPAVKTVIVLEREEDLGDILSFSRLLERGEALFAAGDTRFTDTARDPRDTALLVYTSGTTGNPKGVMLSEENLVSCVTYGLEVSTVYDTCLSVLPYHHTYEAVAGLLVALHHHSTVCINDNLRHVMKNLELFRPDYLYLVPAFAEMFYKKIWANAKSTGKELTLKALIASSGAMRKIGIDRRASLFRQIHEMFGGNLKKIVCGGAPLRREIGDFFDAIGIPLVNGYGITECSPLVSANQDHFNNCETVGVPLRCITVTIDSPDEDGIGEILVRGKTVMRGYYRDPDLTREVLEEDGTFHTGDYGKWNERGQLVITGRKKNMILLCNGENIFPEEIENRLAAIPYLEDAIVFGIKNEEGVETALAAEVYLSDEKLKEYRIQDPDAALRRDVAKACRSLPAYKRPAKIFRRPIPFEKTTTNKIRRSSLLFDKPEN